MIIEGLHEKGIFTEKYPFRLAVNTEEDFRYPQHWHNAVEIVYVLENTYNAVAGGMEFHLEERDILLIAAGDVHGFHNRRNKGRRIFIQFDVSMLDGFGDIKDIKPFLSDTRVISSRESGELHSMLEIHILKIIEEYEKKELAHALSLNARIFDMLVILARSLVKDRRREKSGSDKKIGGYIKINRAFQYIDENFHNEITLKEVAKAVGFSEYHFSRIFKEIAEKSFHRYLNEYRVKKAERLLADYGFTITQVALASGFNSIATFNRAFKEIKGCAPSLYKKMHV